MSSMRLNFKVTQSIGDPVLVQCIELGRVMHYKMHMKYYFMRMRGNSRPGPRKSMSKILWSWLAAFVGIYLVSWVSQWLHTSTTDNVFLIGSFGASAVLLYGAPQAEFSQPRNLVGGHVLSAVVGITVYKLLPNDLALASALAVSLAIAFMHVSRTIHPPGGATALIAVIGSSQVHALGYMFVISPVFIGAVVMLLVALVMNNLSANPKRHYPVFWW